MVRLFKSTQNNSNKSRNFYIYFFEMDENDNENHVGTELKKQEEAVDEEIQNVNDFDEIVEEHNGKHQKENKNVGNQREIDVSAVRTMVKPLEPKLKTKILSHNQYVSNHQLKPSPLQAQSCVRALEMQFPTVRIDLVVKVLHEMLHPICPKGEPRPTFSQTLSEDIPYQRSSRLFTSLPDYTMINSEIRQKEAVNLAIDPRMPEQKRVAISYLNYGYGVRILRDYIKDPNMNPTKYNNIVTCIMKIAFRKLQEYLKSMNKEIVSINSLEQKILRAPLTNCEKWMPPDELQTFYKLIKYGANLISELSIKPNVAVNLYNSCIRQLQERQAKEVDQRRSKNNKRQRPAQSQDYQSSKTVQEKTTVKMPRGRPRGPTNKSLFKSSVNYMSAKSAAGSQKHHTYNHERYSTYNKY